MEHRTFGTGNVFALSDAEGDRLRNRLRNQVFVKNLVSDCDRERHPLARLVAHEQATKQRDFSAAGGVGARRSPRPQIADNRLSVLADRIHKPNAFPCPL